MARLFSPAFNQQFFDENGKPLAAGKLYTYVAGSSTPVRTYKSITGSEINTNPIILDSAGYADFVLELGASYKFVLKDKNDAFKKQWDNVTSADISSVIEGLITDIEGKADKANPSTNGNFAALDAFGNIKDSNHKASDFALQEEFEELSDEVEGKADKDNVVTDVTWDSATRKIKKTINGVDSDIVQVQQSLLQSDPRPINSKAVKDEKYLSVKAQSWTDEEKAQARENINAVEGGDFIPRGEVLYGKVLQISLFDSILSVSDARRTQSGYIAPVAQDTDRGKAAFVTQGERGNELVYRFILEKCDTNAKVIAAIQNGQIPYHTGSAGKYLPYIIADNGDMYLYNIFGVSDKNPMTGDALGLSLRKKVYNGNVVDDCYWGKPYGINNFKLVEYSANDDYGFNIASKKMVWRRIPFDKELTITKFAIVANRDNHNVVQPTYMVGIFDFDGSNVINVSESSTWTYGNMEGFSDTESVACIDDMQSYYGFGDYYIIEFTLPQPLVLQRGGNYLFPCYCNDAVKNGSPTIIAYKSASPALPWEELWTNTEESGNPVHSTAKSGCKASALRLTLSDGTEMWI